ncbi:MAG: translation initiation factor IF-2 [Sphaerochaetaceae bacterium]|nr:translation initiation factor IF-2 [Sphaerochaetaceae bacterium]
MPEDTKPKATLIKQSRPVEPVASAAPAKADVSVEKKKIVIIKKKPVVVVKAQQEAPAAQSAPAPVEKAEPVAQSKPVQTEAPVEKAAPVAPVQKPVQQAPKAPLQSQQPAYRKPVIGVSPSQVVQKKVVKKTQVPQSTINMGPVIISGDNLPPIMPKSDAKPTGGSRPVGSVGGVTYGRDGQRIPNNYNRNQNGNGYGNRQGGYGQNGFGGGQGGFGQNGRPQGYTPRSAQQGNRQGGFGNRQGGFNRDRDGQGPRPGFGGPRPGFGGNGGPRGPMGGGRSGGFSGPSDTMTVDKNRRVYNKDKGKDRRAEQTDEEFELKQFGKKSKNSEPAAAVPKSIDILASITVSDLARKMNIKASEIISKLFSMGMMVSINESIDSDTATIIAEEYGCSVHLVNLYDETIIAREEDTEDDLVPRAPIVTVMGHVDHGKTKTLDAIRSTNVVAGEFGGITQHIGAYKVNIPGKGDIVFLDTPGHAAFTMMRARGAQLTDIVVLVVAANDGVMPQTLEAIDHAKAANVPIIVAINKVDLPDAKPERVMQQLSDRGLMPEEWGGQTLFCQISALKKQGIDELLDTILLQAEMMDLKANPNCRAEGKILEARIDQGRGIVASVVIERGTLKQGDHYVSGIYPGRVRAMFDDKGKKITSAGPSTPVEVIGLSDVPSAGDPFQVCENEKQARQIGTKRQELERLNQASKFKKVTLETLNEAIQDGEVKELNIIIKGDVQGSVEALQLALEKLSTPEIRVRVIRAAAGAIIEDDINLASASENPALVIGFNVRPTPKAQARADQEKIEIRKYNIIYNVVDDVKAAMEGMLSPERTEVDVGTAEVRQVFKVPKVGLVAGCYVTSGSVKRANYCRVIRENIQINHDLVKITSLKRFKDDVREVTMGFECGIGIADFQDLREGDTFEFVEIQEKARKLEDTGDYI